MNDTAGPTPSPGRGASSRTAITAKAIDGSEQKEKRLEHRVELELTHYAGTRARYRVTYLDKTLIQSTRDPELDACRALLAKGIKGTLVAYSPGGSFPRMRIDIEKGAQLMSIDNTADGPRIGRYRRHPKSTDRDDEE